MGPAQHGYVIVYTGNGKGKTTAAIGLAIRAAGQGMRVFIGQFVKARRDTGEAICLARFADMVEMQQLGSGFVYFKDGRPNPTQRDIEAARRGCALIEEKVSSGKYDMIILDEINNAVQLALVPLSWVIDLIKSKPERLHLVLTGRGASPQVLDLADIATEMREIKHPFAMGEPARSGIEF